jgi:hypothetical protein
MEGPALWGAGEGGRQGAVSVAVAASGAGGFHPEVQGIALGQVSQPVRACGQLGWGQDALRVPAGYGSELGGLCHEGPRSAARIVVDPQPQVTSWTGHVEAQTLDGRSLGEADLLCNQQVAVAVVIRAQDIRLTDGDRAY